MTSNHTHCVMHTFCMNLIHWTRLESSYDNLGVITMFTLWAPSDDFTLFCCCSRTEDSKINMIHCDHFAKRNVDESFI